MKIIYNGVNLPEIITFEVEDPDKKVLEGIFNFNILKLKHNVISDYFYFYDDDNKMTSERYYINKTALSRKEMQKVDEIYADFMKISNLDYAIPAYNDKGEILEFYPVYEDDKLLTVK